MRFIIEPPVSVSSLMKRTRRLLLTALASGSTLAAAGCLDTVDESSAQEGVSTEEPDQNADAATEANPQEDLGVPCGETDGQIELSGGRLPTELSAASATPTTEYADEEIPLRDEPLHLGYNPSKYADGDISGGVNHDGIPSIDEPSFVTAGEVSLPSCERVFGVSIDGDVRAYPQRILVRHEVVNDVVGGDPVAVTYCPLTGTAQGFRRGGVEFGVSGQLVNSNLIMWDRAHDVRWPQIGATATEVGDQRDGGAAAGELVGESLQEFDVTWTTWRRWHQRYPDTLVLSTETGTASNYNRDPYGSYTPVSGHYAVGEPRQPKFPLLGNRDINQEKRVVIGARTSQGAVAFDKQRLLDESMLTGQIDGERLVAVADAGLATAHVYRAPTDREIIPQADGYRVDGTVAPADRLPLDTVVSFDTMWFPWLGFYPATTTVGFDP